MKFLDVPQSGSIAGTTHSHNRAGQYTRNRRSPVQPVGSGRRGIVRGNFGTASAAWAGLTNVQREAWNSFADSHPVTDSLGSSITLTGHQMYVRVACNALNINEAPPSTPPTSLTLPDLSSMTLSFSVATGVSLANFSGSGDAWVVVALSRPFSAGRSFNKTFWQPFSTNGYTAADATPFTLTTALYAAEFGTPSIGQRVFVRVVGLSTGLWNSSPVIMSTIVVA